MALYAVGDLQGCYSPLVKLLDRVNFDPTSDTLWCVGDLVNRGPDSLATLRFLRSLGDSCQCVLGNHDIHFLAMAYGARRTKPGDSLTELLAADDLTSLAKWLRRQPLMFTDTERKLVMCHAGVYPWWSIKQAQKFAREVERQFYDKKSCIKLLKKVYGDRPHKWDDGLGAMRRARFIINAFTRMRFCSPSGNLNLSEKGFNGKIRKNRIPWFDIKNKGRAGYRVVFGHWSALGLLLRDDVLALDTGYVWGNRMTMAKLPDTNDQEVVLYHQA